jgi:hypothetical protein
MGGDGVAFRKRFRIFSNRVFQGEALFFFLMLISPTIVLAQAPTDSSSAGPAPPTQPTTEGIQKARNEYGIWGGIAFHAPTLIGKTPDARFGDVGFRYGRVLTAAKAFTFEWTIDAVPVAILANSRSVIAPEPGGGLLIARERKSVYGFGAAPIGLKFSFRPNRRVQPFVHATGGFLYFGEDVPVDDAARFNFTFDFGGGVRIVSGNRRAFMIGYKYQHLSNGYRSPINPGADAEMIFGGFSIFR